MLSDREKFIYFSTSLALDKHAQGMPQDKRTILLELIRNEYCKTVTNKDWLDIFQSVEPLREHIASNVVKDLLSGYSDNKIANMFAQFVTKGKIGYE